MLPHAKDNFSSLSISQRHLALIEIKAPRTPAAGLNGRARCRLSPL